MLSWADGDSIDLDYIDPRPQERKDEDELRKEQVRLVKEQKDQEWDEEKRRLEAEGREVPEKEEWVESPVYPDWGQSPIEVS
jgi:PAS domain-containing protein